MCTEWQKVERAHHLIPVKLPVQQLKFNFGVIAASIFNTFNQFIDWLIWYWLQTSEWT